MVSHRDIAQSFAQGQTKATGSRMFIEDDTVFSYGRHYEICKRVNGMYLFNGNGYSVSTAKHKSYVRSAIGWDNCIVLDDKLELRYIPKQRRRNQKILDELTTKQNKRHSKVRQFEIDELTTQQQIINNWLDTEEGKSFIDEAIAEEI